MKTITRILLFLAFTVIAARSAELKMYPVTAEDKAFLEQIKKVVLADDAEAFSKMISYPVAIRPNDKTVKLQGPADVKKNSAAIFTARLISAVQSQTPDSLFKNWRGVMIGDGEIWFSKVLVKDDQGGNWKYRIIGINPETSSAHNAANVRPAGPPNFESYPEQSNPIKRFAKTKTPESGIDWKMREYLRFSDDNPLNFAGKYTLFEIGCGTGCVEFCLIDRTSGTVFPGKDFNQDFPEGYDGLMGLQYRQDSRLLVVYHATARKYPVFVDYYVWDGAKLDLLRSDRIQAKDNQTAR